MRYRDGTKDTATTFSPNSVVKHGILEGNAALSAEIGFCPPDGFRTDRLGMNSLGHGWAVLDHLESACVPVHHQERSRNKLSIPDADHCARQHTLWEHIRKPTGSIYKRRE